MIEDSFTELKKNEELWDDIQGFMTIKILPDDMVEAMVNLYPRWSKPIMDARNALGVWPQVRVGHFYAEKKGIVSRGLYTGGQNSVRVAAQESGLDMWMTIVHECAHLCQNLGLLGYDSRKEPHPYVEAFGSAMSEYEKYRHLPAELCANTHMLNGLPFKYKWSKPVIKKRLYQWGYMKMSKLMAWAYTKKSE
jgi:hypothetical protein